MKSQHERYLRASKTFYSQDLFTDLKPENVLFKSKDASSPIMITDFGLSALYTNDKMLKTACGTPGYAAPEVLQRVPYNEKVREIVEG